MNLQELRKLIGLTQTEFAEVLHTKQPTISRFESQGRNLDFLKISQVKEIAEHCDFTFEELLEITGVVE